MEKITSFSNVKEFQEIFGKNQFGGRKNKILLTLLKCKDFWDYREDFKYFFEDVTSMKSQQYLFKSVLDALKIYCVLLPISALPSVSSEKDIMDRTKRLPKKKHVVKHLQIVIYS